MDFRKNKITLGKKLDINLIGGLKGGLLHYAVCGGSVYRKSIFKEQFKKYCDGGEIIHKILSAPRDGRYKIDWYTNLR